MAFKTEDILLYIESTAGSNVDLANKIKVTKPGEPMPGVSDYGLRVYFGEENWKENTRTKIGPIMTEVYRVNVDLVFNRSLKSRQMFSDGKGISYWENALTSMFANKTNNGTFKDSYWSPSVMETNADSIVIKGLFNAVIQNQYGTP